MVAFFCRDLGNWVVGDEAQTAAQAAAERPDVHGPEIGLPAALVRPVETKRLVLQRRALTNAVWREES